MSRERHLVSRFRAFRSYYHIHKQFPPDRQTVQEVVEGDTMTSLGALRATFIPPSFCTSDIYKFGPDNGYYFLLGP